MNQKESELKQQQTDILKYINEKEFHLRPKNVEMVKKVIFGGCLHN